MEVITTKKSAHPLIGAARSREAMAARFDTLPALAARIEADVRLPEDFRAALKAVIDSGLQTLAPLCPAILRLNGVPYTLDEHFVFEPLFRTRMPKALQLKTGRQTGKSVGLAAQGVLSTAAIPKFNTVYITPLFEMARRFSTNYIKPFIAESPLRELFCDEEDLGSVFQRDFINGSKMFFTYALFDATRTRGLPGSRLTVDEVQDSYLEVLPLLERVIDGVASWRLRQFAGTPKGTSNPVHVLWGDSSQAEWVIPCQRGGCNHWNIPSLGEDLLDMIGPWHRDIGPGNAGLVCAKCRKPLDSRLGHWFHFQEHQRFEFEGLHVPQSILPFHCEDPDRWAEIVDAHHGRHGITEAMYLNEVQGESCDSGASVVTEAELKRAACLPWPCKAKEAMPQARAYPLVILAVDWGGGGGSIVPTKQGKITRKSFTTMAVLGTQGSGQIDVLWGYRSPHSHDHLREARLIAEAFRNFRCKFLVHDYGGDGGTRDTLLISGGMDRDLILPVRYHGPALAPIVRHAATIDRPREWTGLDKSWSLGNLAEGIRYGLVRFFQDDFKSPREPGLLRDFTALFAERFTSLPSNDIYRIGSHPALPDDFAQAVNIGSAMAWELTDSWPQFAKAEKYLIPENIKAAIADAPGNDWDEI